MPPSKRLFDICLSLLLGVPVVIMIAVLSGIVLIFQGRPIFFVSERMRTPDQGFQLIKFRTMIQQPDDHSASGGFKADRVTELGKLLRKYRLDELPQIWNVLSGDMSFVGPRPPLRRYVELCPSLYQQVLISRPGVTGLATVVYRKAEERLLSGTKSRAENEGIYLRQCVSRKARLDQLYLRRQSIWIDLRIIAATAFSSIRPLPKPDRTPKRRQYGRFAIQADMNLPPAQREA